MAFCQKCGANLPDNASFCAICGAPQSASGGQTPAAGPARTQMAENIAAMLCYSVGWITGLIFYFIDKRPFVRYHAVQSIVVFGGLHILSFLIAGLFGLTASAGGMIGFSLGYSIYWLVNVAALILWVVLMVKAYRGERFRVPVAADIAEKLFGNA